MRMVVIGAESPLGMGLRTSVIERPGEAWTWVPSADVDLCNPDSVAELLAGATTVIHLESYAAAGGQSDRALLDRASRGVWVLLHAALEQGVARLVFVSTLAVFAGVQPDAVIDETFRPRPGTSAGELAPYLGELAVREFVRALPLSADCIRLEAANGAGVPESMDLACSAIAAAARAVQNESRYRWRLFHISRDVRFPSAGAHAALGLSEKV